MIMCIQNLVLIGPFVFRISSKNSILTSIKGSNSVANLPKLELIQAFMHVLDTCKNEEDPINQRTNGPVNAHLVSWPRKAQNIQNLENIW